MAEKKTFSQIELEIMKRWEQEKTFEKSVEQRDPKNSYVFYDGPPFATGLPHYGHIVASTMKDIVPRYWAMKGKKVERRWGWDCHGLPIENIVEKELKLNGRKDIEDFGVAKFNETCETKIGLYAEEWKKTIKRIGRWVDMEADYKTMDLDFMESVWWVFKSLYEKGLVYEGHKSMHICPRCETTLSNIEVSQGYKDIKDISITAKFELADEPNTYILAWTTTPWTLPGNVALAVGEKIDYVKVKFEDQNYIVAKDLVEKVFADKKYEVIEQFLGSQLENKFYRPLFDFFVGKDLPNKENLYKIVTADFVSTEDGTGVVHLAPAFGEDDMNIGKEKDLSFIQHVGPDGRFMPEVTLWAGEEVKPKEDISRADIEILKYLAGKGLLFSKEKYEHSYPHCWRCDSPLLNYATHSWFIEVTKIKDRLLKKAKEINWVPDHLKEGRFGQWLEGARDWSISRSRYWGNPMPVWKCDKCQIVKVIGSKNELEQLTGEKVTDIHKHKIDNLTFNCEKCDGQMERIPQVFDCWVESGAMPYGQMHYPFENKEKFEANFPAEFIAEGVDQTRAWFYVMHVLSVALFDKPAYKNVVVNGILLAEDGQKMSKSKQNYPDPMLVIEKYGADALRYYLATSPVMRAEDLSFSEKGVDEIYKKMILITSNVLSFYQMFEAPVEAEMKVINVLDRWLLAKVNLLISEITENMEAYELTRAAKPLLGFVDELSTWYVRRSRDRFKGEDDADRLSAIYTLRYALEKLSLVMAPFMPYMAEYLWQNIGNTGSVHLQDWPVVDKKLIDKKTLEQMDQTRRLVELALSMRDEKQIKVRQPLLSLVYQGVELSKEFELIVADELNVKKVERTEDFKVNDDMILREATGLKAVLDTKITEELKLEGHLRELIRNINNLRKNGGLTREDRITLYWESESEEIKKLLENNSWQQELKRSVVAEKLVREKNTDLELVENFKVNGQNIWVGIEK